MDQQLRQLCPLRAAPAEEPLAGAPARPVLFQVAKGDYQITNPSATALLRAGDLADRTTFYRHDLAMAESAAGLPKNPHGALFFNFLPMAGPLQLAIGRALQDQVAEFFASGGATIPQPEPARFFEVPIAGPLPEELNFIP